MYLGYNAALHAQSVKMRPTVTDVPWSVYASLCWTLPWAVPKQINRSIYSLGCALVDSRPCISWAWGLGFPTRGSFGGNPLQCSLSCSHLWLSSILICTMKYECYSVTQYLNQWSYCRFWSTMLLSFAIVATDKQLRAQNRFPVYR